MIIGVSGHRSHKIKIGYHDGSNVFVQWRLRRLAKTYLKHYNPEEVIAGMATGFDTAVAEACVELGIPYTAAIPFKGQESRWEKEQRQIYKELLEKAKNVHVVYKGPPSKKAYLDRNKFIVDNADMMLVLWDKKDKVGGTSHAVYYAYNNNKEIVNLWDIWEKRKEAKFPFSNFQAVSIVYEGESYPSVENFFQAMKVLDPFERHRFTLLKPTEAKAYGKTVEVRKDWEDVKDEIMKKGLEIKFSRREYHSRLMGTGDDELIHWNTWHDNHYGICYCNRCNGEGDNLLGKMIMDIRSKYKYELFD